MDHFNATVKDGKLVNTRRGLQVSRQKFNGISFVNTSAQTPSPGSDSFSVSDTSSKTPRQVKFVEKGNESRPGSSRSSQTQDFSFVSDSGQSKRPRRRAAATKDRNLTASPASSSHKSSRSSPLTPSGDVSYEFADSSGMQVVPSMDFGLDSTTADTSSTWSAQEDASTYISEDDWKLFQHYYAQMPYISYPYEDILTYNPTRSDDLYSLVVGDFAAIHCVLMCGAIAEAVLSSQTDSKGFAYHISKICSILNMKLDQNQAADAVTLHCIATLAGMGCYVGRLDHWHMHMSGLQRVVDVNGGLGGLPPWLLAKMHTADLRGAAALASSPYLSFTRYYSSVSTVLPMDVREYASASLSTLLGPLQVSPEVIGALASLAAFTSAVRMARDSGRTVAFDPHAFTEEWQTIMQVLITRPRPLREVKSADHPSSNPYWSGMSSSRSSEGSSSSGAAAENYMENHRLRHGVVPVVPAAPLGPGGHVEPALRIAALLFLKELLPDWPRNLGGYAVLLSLFQQHLQGILQAFTGSSRSSSKKKGKSGNVSHNLLDPLLLAGSHGSSSPVAAALKPVIIFLALVGNMSSLLGSENEGRYEEEGDQYPRGVYADCLRYIAGIGDEESIGLLEEEGDFVVLRMFDLRHIRGQEGWDERVAMGELLCLNGGGGYYEE
ncbi:hypothetical protein QBC35DRAFT_66174 [Podospora australis]|uniref:Uncharacterized protein n=1 Tax=Podospora australis TaxID=1536484 RepID=A0AAN6WL73_9PEZI|nr:hypothetical protein QBC35DRAFT_66174 [Podospora australis]